MRSVEAALNSLVIEPFERHHSVMKRTNVILSLIAVVWGGAILFVRLSSTSSSGGSAYTTGAIAAILFGLLLVVCGGYVLAYELRRRSR